MKKEILKQLKSDYEELEIKPSADLWDRIEQGSPVSPVLSAKKRFQWLRYAAVLIFLFSTGILLYFNQDHKADRPDPGIAHTASGGDVPEAKLKKLLSEPRATEADNKNTEEDPDYSQIRKNVKATASSEKEDILEKSGPVLVKEEKIIIPTSEIEINAPTLDRTISLLPEKSTITDRKKADYIKADELLQGREFDKKREENKTDIRKFGALDMTKIKIKSPSPSSLKILGMTVFSDSLEKK